MVKKVILDTMTGDEFKKYVEQVDPNGQIDTLQEVLRALQGISDGETIAEFIDRTASTAHLSEEDRALLEKVMADIESGEYGLTEEERELLNAIKDLDIDGVATNDDIDEMF